MSVLAPFGGRDEQDDYIVDRLTQSGRNPTLALVAMTVGIVATVFVYDLSRLWLIGGSIASGAVVLTIFALAKNLYGLWRPSPPARATSDTSARESAP